MRPTHHSRPPDRRASTRPGRRAAAASPARACCRSGPCASSRARSRARASSAASAPRRRRAPDPLDRGRAEQREPEPAVRAEALLRGEVVGVGLARRRAGSPAAPEVASISDQGLAGAARAGWPRPSPRSRSRCAPRRSRRRAGSATGAGASPGSASITIGSARNGAAGGHPGELAGELAVGEVERALAHEAGRGGVPERRRAAVAEHDLVALGGAEQLGEPAADAPDEVPDRGLAVRCERRPDDVGALGKPLESLAPGAMCEGTEARQRKRPVAAGFERKIGESGQAIVSPRLHDATPPRELEGARWVSGRPGGRRTGRAASETSLVASGKAAIIATQRRRPLAPESVLAIW